MTALPSDKDKRKRSKTEALLEEGALNTGPEKVRDPKFEEGEFFDPRDLVQVKYEMLRRVRVENASVTQAAEEYGFSRPTYYQARAGFDEAGIPGLAFLKRQLVSGQPMRARELAKLVRQEFQLDVHPRTIERVLGGKKNVR
jgi:Homeodomain-like domain